VALLGGGSGGGKLGDDLGGEFFFLDMLLGIKVYYII
jgi:hypothetical protein